MNRDQIPAEHGTSACQSSQLRELLLDGKVLKLAREQLVEMLAHVVASITTEFHQRLLLGISVEPTDAGLPGQARLAVAVVATDVWELH